MMKKNQEYSMNSQKISTLKIKDYASNEICQVSRIR
jgi:hypothetical protein